MNRYSSIELIEGIRKRDSAVLEFLYKNCYPKVMRFILNNRGTSHDAKDIFQEAMIVVFENIRANKSFSISSNIQTYIFSVARNIWIKNLTRLRFDLSELNENHEFINFVEPEPYYDHESRFALFQKVFMELPDDCQKILAMISKGFSHKEIADALGIKSVGYIKKRRHYCKEYLIRLIKENPDYQIDN